ncbi:MAG: YHS domain-containing protein [Ignavibacteriota bacterium]
MRNLKVIVLTALLVIAVKTSYGQHEHNGTDTTVTNKVKDVVCGMEVEKNDSLLVLYNEKEYYFCSNKHMLAFLKQPQKYIGENMQNHSEHKMEEHNMDHGMMGMSTPLMIILGAVMISAMVVGMTGVMK